MGSQYGSQAVQTDRKWVSWAVNPADHKRYGEQLLNLIVRYRQHVHQKTVMVDVQPGFLKNMLPTVSSQDPHPWNQVI